MSDLGGYTYWAINAVFLAVVALVVLAALLVRRAPRWRAVGLTAVPLLLLTAVFDNVIIGVGLVDYDPAVISGVRLGIAPVEDFAYTVAAVVLLPSLWALLERRGTRAPAHGPVSASPSPSAESGPFGQAQPERRPRMSERPARAVGAARAGGGAA